VRSSKHSLAVNQDRYRPVVDEFDFHHGSEDAALDVQAAAAQG
jgi:hypothetical protein